MDTTTRVDIDGFSSETETLSIPLHLARYAAEVDQWHREALAVQAARAAGR